MSTTSVRIVGLLLLLGLWLVPATALAAPSITITPAAVPRGGEVTVTGTGFAPNLQLAVVAEPAPGRRVPLGEVTTAADGTFRFTITVPTSAAPGTIDLLILAPDNSVLARGTATVTDAPPVSAEQVRIDPPTGPVGTRFVATGSGFPAGATYRVGTAPRATGPQTPPERQVLIGTVQVGTDGRFTVTIDSTGYPPEEYDFVVFGSRPDPVFVARFTVTPAGAPGLPNTGGGGSARRPMTTYLPLAGALLAVGLGLLGSGRPRWARRFRRQ